MTYPYISSILNMFYTYFGSSILFFHLKCSLCPFIEPSNIYFIKFEPVVVTISNFTY